MCIVINWFGAVMYGSCVKEEDAMGGDRGLFGRKSRVALSDRIGHAFP